MTGAGFLDRRITLERATTVRNWANEPIDTWGTLATVYANKADATAGETYRAQEVGAEITARFTIRYSPTVANLNPRDRISFGGRLYNITGVRETERHRWLEVDCVARDDIAAVDETSP